jgi:hypothetical protein
MAEFQRAKQGRTQSPIPIPPWPFPSSRIPTPYFNSSTLMLGDGSADEQQMWGARAAGWRGRRSSGSRCGLVVKRFVMSAALQTPLGGPLHQRLNGHFRDQSINFQVSKLKITILSVPHFGPNVQKTKKNLASTFLVKNRYLQNTKILRSKN